MLSRVSRDALDVVPDDDIDAELLAAIGTRAELERGGLEGRARAKELVVFAPLGEGSVFPGYSWHELRDGRRERAERGVLCQTAVELQCTVGCPFDCTYCPYTSFVCVRVDVERFVDQAVRLVQGRPGQLLYKLNNRTDTLGLEPEYGLAPALVRRFAELDGKYLMLYSKGDAVDGLVELDHRGKTIAAFSLAPESVAGLVEWGAPSPAERLAAMGRLARAGYPIRVRLSPIVPVRGWREDYRDLIVRLAEVACPEMVTLWTLSMVAFEDLDRIVSVHELDDEVVHVAREAADGMRGTKGAPFPPSVRAEIYRQIAEIVAELMPEARLALCLETEEVWSALEPVLGPRAGESFLCNCGPRATPLRL